MVLQAVASRLPANGCTSAQILSLLQREFPQFSPSTVGVVTMKEALEKYPQLFCVANEDDGRWTVRRANDERSPLNSRCKSERYLKLVDYCSAVSKSTKKEKEFLPLEDCLRRSGCRTKDRMAAVVDEILSHSRQLPRDLDLRVSLAIRVRRPQRSAIVFVDGDELSASVVDGMCSELQLIKSECSVTVVRRSSSEPLTPHDVCSPEGTPTSLKVESLAQQLTMQVGTILKDVVFLCAPRKYQVYATHIAPAVSFPDADVYVCCPTKVELISAKRIIPFADV